MANISQKKQEIKSIIGKSPRQKFLSKSQKEYYELLINKQITVCSGPAGVGKSFISMRPC